MCAHHYTVWCSLIISKTSFYRFKRRLNISRGCDTICYYYYYYIHSVSELFNDVFERRRITPVSISTGFINGAWSSVREDSQVVCAISNRNGNISKIALLFSRRVIEGHANMTRASTLVSYLRNFLIFRFCRTCIRVYLLEKRAVTEICARPARNCGTDDWE